MNRLKLLFLLILVMTSSVAIAQTADFKQTLTIEEFTTKLRQAKYPQVLDARTTEEYNQNHLHNAISINSKEEGYNEKINALKKESPVFIYSINNGRSTALAKELTAKGFKEVYVLPGGIIKWISSGNPYVDNGGKGLSLNAYNNVLQSDKIVLVDFGSKYCGGCKRILPTIDSLETEQASTLKVIKIEAYDNKQLLKDLQISAIPTVVLYKNNEVIWRKSGFVMKAEIEKEIVKNNL